MPLAEAQARWDRLRSDPDFERGWLRTMGSRPTAASYRTWGDGVGRKSAHRIAEVSYADGYVICECGWTGSASGGVEWVAHFNGGQSEVGKTFDSQRLEEATDDEVAQFLADLSGEHAHSTVAGLNVEPIAGDGEAHSGCRHGEYCLVGYGALMLLVNNPVLLDRFAAMEAAS